MYAHEEQFIGMMQKLKVAGLDIATMHGLTAFAHGMLKLGVKNAAQFVNDATVREELLKIRYFESLPVVRANPCPVCKDILWVEYSQATGKLVCHRKKHSGGYYYAPKNPPRTPNDVRELTTKEGD